MLQNIAESTIYLLIVSPLIAISYDRDKKNIKAILLASLYYILYSIVLVSPLRIKILDFLGFHYNWAGKLYSTAFSCLAYLFLKKYIKGENYFTFKQKKGSAGLTIILIFAPLLVLFLINILFSNGEVFDIETLIFQMTMPGIDEEIAYRGILFGLFAVSLKSNLKIGKLSLGNSGLLITSILFGLSHGFKIENDWKITIVYSNILFTGSMGYLFGYITYHSRSIFGSVISHNLINTFAYLVRVIFN